MIKKFLIFLMVISVLPMVIGDEPPQQGITVTIGQDIYVLINPQTIDFNNVLPGTTGNDAAEDVSFDAAGSNVDVNVEVTSVTPEPFTTGLKFDGTLAQGQDINLPCVLSGNLCTYTLKTVDTTLDIPATFKIGIYPGTIVYTITGLP